jgi:hypothetical protein
MPVQQGVSLEWIETKEDEIAKMVSAAESVDELRRLAGMLLERGFITRPHHDKLRGVLDDIATALQMGKRNTAMLRNEGGR